MATRCFCPPESANIFLDKVSDSKTAKLPFRNLGHLFISHIFNVKRHLDIFKD